MNATSEQNSTHTEGPWLAASHPSSVVGWPVVAKTGRLICTIATPPKNIDRIGKAKEEYDAFMAECEANARLIGVAPQLLGALRFILAFYEPGQYHLDTEAWKVAEASARALVAKAEGRS